MLEAISMMNVKISKGQFFTKENPLENLTNYKVII